MSFYYFKGEDDVLSEADGHLSSDLPIEDGQVSITAEGMPIPFR